MSEEKIRFVHEWTGRTALAAQQDVLCRVRNLKGALAFARWVAAPSVVLGLVGKLVPLEALFLAKGPDAGVGRLAVNCLLLVALYAMTAAVCHVLIRQLALLLATRRCRIAGTEVWTITDKELRVQVKGVSVALSWESVAYAHETPSGFWVGQNARAGVFVPRVALEECGCLEAFLSFVPPGSWVTVPSMPAGPNPLAGQD